MTITTIQPITNWENRARACAKNTEQNLAHPERVITLSWLPVCALRVDDSYQRNISDRSRTNIYRMLAGFDWCKFGTLMVAEIPDQPESYTIIDGQHRAIAAASLGIANVPAVIVAAQNTMAEANTFIGVNVARTGVSTVDKFRARAAAGEELACDLAEIIDTQNITLGLSDGYVLAPRATRAIARMLALMKTYGKGTLGTALEMLLDAQPDSTNLLKATTIAATTMVLDRLLNAEIEITPALDRFDAVLTNADFEDITNRAFQISRIAGGQVANHMATAMMKSLNHGRTARLPEAF